MHLTEEQSAFVESIRRMVERHIAPIAAEIDETDRFPEELVPIFGDMGLLQQWVPEEYGGPGGNLTMLCLAKHEIAKVSMACSILAGQNSMGMVLPVLHFGSEEQKRRFLPLAAKGRTLTAVAMSEPHCGSDVAAMKTKAVRDGSSYVINGQKCFITFGSVADWIMLFARTSEGRGVDGISAFMVDTKTPGFKVGRNERKMGLGGVPNVQLFFEDMRIPVENRLGEEGQGFKACMHILNLNRPTVAAASIGLGQGALDCAINYAKERKAFGKAIATNQGLQWMIADMAIQLEAARALLFECTRQVDLGDFSQLSMMASMAKCFGSDAAMKVTTDAVQIFGGVGYLKDYPVERMMRDAKINQIWEGTNQIQRIVISRHLLGREA
ncbi:MAG: acyl-CoA dehydrogenase family protein [Rhizobiales bacterium]|nr:acyl-CoA dehydrogenase family protein [Hyphomicrobiales bacterium]